MSLKLRRLFKNNIILLVGFISLVTLIKLFNFFDVKNLVSNSLVKRDNFRKNNGRSSKFNEFATLDNVPESSEAYADWSSNLFELFDLNSTSDSNLTCITTRTDPPFNVCVHTVSVDIWISTSLTGFGLWEVGTTNLLQNLLNQAPDSIFVDLGANIGYYSLMAAKMGHQVVAVEPVKEQIDRIHRASQLDGTTGFIKLIQNALSDKRGVAKIFMSINNQGDSRVEPLTSGESDLLKQEMGKNKITHIATSSTIQTILLNDLTNLVYDLSMLPLPPPPATSNNQTSTESLREKSESSKTEKRRSVLLKIDVQGFEHKVLYKADRFFDINNVSHVFMEWLPMKIMHPSNVNKTFFDFFPSHGNDMEIIDSLIRFFKDRKYLPYKAEDFLYEKSPLKAENWPSWPDDVMWYRAKS